MVTWLRRLLCKFGWHTPAPGIQRGRGVGFLCAYCPEVHLYKEKSRG